MDDVQDYQKNVDVRRRRIERDIEKELVTKSVQKRRLTFLFYILEVVSMCNILALS